MELQAVQCMCGSLMEKIVTAEDMEEYLWEKWVCGKCKEQIHLKWRT